MSKKPKNPKRPHRKHSSLQDHHRHRKTLTPPLLNIAQGRAFDWRLREPDMLWLAAQQVEHPSDLRAVDRALDAIDPFAPAPGKNQGILDGRLTTFDFIPIESRAWAREALLMAAPETLTEGLGQALMLFEGRPAAWLYPDDAVRPNPDTGLEYLRTLLLRLVDSRSIFSVHTRMLSLGRYFAHERIAFAPGLQTVPLLARYPGGLSEDERSQVRQFCKLNYDMVITMPGSGNHGVERRWGEAFWLQCGRLAAMRRP
jgi:hypothetical protein